MNIPPYTTDTSPDAHRVQLECIRNMRPIDRVALMQQMSDSNRDMAFAAIKRANPDFDEQQVALKYIELVHGKSLAIEMQAALEGRGCGR